MDTAKSDTDTPPLVELRVWMARKGYRQRRVGREIGIGDGEMSRYLNGQRDLALEHIAALAEMTGIPPERLVTDPNTSRNLKRLRTIPKFPKANRRSRG